MGDQEERKMTNQEMLKIAMEQSAEDIGCTYDDLASDRNVSVPFRMGKNAKKFMKEDSTCAFISYGKNIVAASIPELSELVSEYIARYKFYHCFEPPNMQWLNERLVQKGQKICFMCEYYLPDLNRLPERTCAYEMRVLEQSDFADLYRPEWSNALCEERKHLDVLGVGAYDGIKQVGFAACSADAELMWQIGVDVLAEYRQQGIASALTCRLTREILARDKVPFYCTAWSNVRSVGNAIKSGFVPTWVEMHVKPAARVDELNEEREDQPSSSAD